MWPSTEPNAGSLEKFTGEMLKKLEYQDAAGYGEWDQMSWQWHVKRALEEIGEAICATTQIPSDYNVRAEIIDAANFLMFAWAVLGDADERKDGATRVGIAMDNLDLTKSTNQIQREWDMRDGPIPSEAVLLQMKRYVKRKDGAE